MNPIGLALAYERTWDAVTRIFADGNLVVVGVGVQGDHDRDYGPYKATGTSLELTGAHIIEVEGGKLKTVLSRWDRLGMLLQLGLV